VVAAADIAQFSTLTPGLLKVQHLPKDAWIPPGTFDSIDKVVGRVNSSAIVMGEPLSTTRLAAKGTGQPLGLEIPRGMRAFTIQMPNVASSVAGFTRAGSKVDVLVTMKNKGVNDTKGPVSTTLLEDIKVLAVDQHVEEPTAGKLDPKEVRSITLLVNPDQADKLAQHCGDLQLSLRNPEDNSLKTKQTTAPATSVVRNPPALIQMIRGTQSHYLELR
jgi:pilus assembly protein CpaB